MSHNALANQRPSGPPGANQAARPGLPPVVLAAARGACRRWWLCAVGLVGSFGAAFALAGAMSVKSWEASCTLMYVPLPVSEQNKSLYTAPDLKTLTGLVITPQTLESLKDAFKLPIPTKVLQVSLTSTVPNGTKNLTLAFRWQSREQAIAMLGKFVELYMAQVAELRKARLGEHIADFDRAIADCNARLEEASRAVAQFHRREKLLDYKNELASATGEISQLEDQIARNGRSEASYLVQIGEVNAYLDRIKRQQDEEASEEDQFEAATETVTDNRRRQDRLRELIEEDKRLSELKAQLEVKKAEYNRIARLQSRGAASGAELDAIKAEVTVLQTKINDSKKVQEWKAELERIDQMVIPKAKKKKTGSPIIVQTLTRKFELELAVKGLREEADRAQAEIARKREEVERLEGLKGEHEALLRKVESLDNERRSLEAQRAALAHLRDLKGGEFVVVTPPTAGPDPVSSNKKTLLAGIGGVGMMATLGLVGLLGLRDHARSLAARSQRLGLTILDEVRAPAAGLRREHLRRVALRLRQTLPEYGTVVLFTAPGETDTLPAMLEGLGGCLARRDERVLILDARHGQHPESPLGLGREAAAERPARRGPGPDVLPLAQAEPPLGLGDYLLFRSQEVDEICRPTEHFGVDLISAGDAPIEPELLATHRMNELIEELRRRYSILLMIGPSLDHPVDLQILAPMVQGIVAVLDGKARVTGATSMTLKELRMLDAPLLGQVIVSNE